MRLGGHEACQPKTRAGHEACQPKTPTASGVPVGRLAKRDPTRLVQRGRVGFGATVSLSFNRDLTVGASARDAVDFAATALRDWFEEAHRTGQRFDAGLLPRDRGGSSWVGFDTGLLAGNWRVLTAGDDRTAAARVALLPPDQQRALRLASLAKQGIRLSGLSGRALDVYHRAVARYMADVIAG